MMTRDDPSSQHSQKQTYIELCAREPGIPVFSQPWWLDVTAGPENWNVALVERGDQVVAAMPYCVQERFGMKIIKQPQLTKFLGPWVRPDVSKSTKRLAREKDVLGALIDQLPDYHYFSQNWHHSRKNWLPFYWRGFQQTTRYTYILHKIQDQNLIWDGLAQNIRTDIRKARDRFHLRVRDDLGIEDVLSLNRMVFARQGIQVPYSDDYVKRLDDECQRRGSRLVLVAEDLDGRRHASVYIVWDANSAYYLIGGADPDLRSSGATSLCLWEAIRRAAEFTESFDFEGSMIEEIERFFRAFGAEQTAYFNVKDVRRRRLKALEVLRSFRAGG